MFCTFQILTMFKVISVATSKTAVIVVCEACNYVNVKLVV